MKDAMCNSGRRPPGENVESESRGGLSRAPWQRMLRIHEWIQSGKYPNCFGMAKELEVSHKTVTRDVAFMRDRLNLPLQYDGKRFGFFYTRPVEKFPGIPINEAEMFALLVAHKAIAQYRGTPFERPLSLAFTKLTSHLDMNERFSLDSLQEALSFRPFAPEDTDLHAFETLTRALQERRALIFQYRNLGVKTKQSRRVYPYHLACIENHWYLFGHDVDRHAIRTFALTRLTAPELTDERFTKPDSFDPNEYLRGSLTVFKGGDDYEVLIEFDAWATDLVRRRQWHVTQEFTELPGGASRLRMRLSSLEEIEQWVLSWGTHATIVRPQELADRVAAIASEVAQRYVGEVANQELEARSQEAELWSEGGGVRCE